jgi:predicted transcriptional regulator
MEHAMALDATSYSRLKILGFLRDRGGSCNDLEWKGFDIGSVHLDPYMEDLKRQGYVLHKNDTYFLTDSGKQEIILLESHPN